MDEYFTRDKIRELTTKNGWEMVPSIFIKNHYILRQKDSHYMRAIPFRADRETVQEFCGHSIRE